MLYCYFATICFILFFDCVKTANMESTHCVFSAKKYCKEGKTHCTIFFAVDLQTKASIIAHS